MFTYSDAIEYIHSTNKFGIKLGLDNIKCLLKKMGNPQNSLKFIHVAGTNGKGSVVSLISTVLEQAGYKVGKYISPFIQVFNERISINGVNISDEDLASITCQVKCHINEMLSEGYNHPTEFEIVTAIAFGYYAQMQCDIVVLEVGLGGRFDSTNIISPPELAVITPIDFDHVGILGNSLAEIAFEKAGIIKENINVVCAQQKLEALSVIENVCAQKNANLIITDEVISIDEEVPFLSGSEFEVVWVDGEHLKIHINLLGEHQVQNAAIAFCAIKELVELGYDISIDAVKKGLELTVWNGRLQKIGDNPLFLVDGAHNPQGAMALRQAIDNIKLVKNDLYVIVGIMSDKSVEQVVKPIVEVAKAVYTIQPNNDRALSAEDLKKAIFHINSNVESCNSIYQAIQKCLLNAQENDFILAFGSLYYVGEVLTFVETADER